MLKIKSFCPRPWSHNHGGKCKNNGVYAHGYEAVRGESIP